MGPASIIPNPRKQRAKYYVNPNTDSERSAYLRCEFPIEYGRSPLHAYTAVLRGYVGAVMPLHIKTPISRLEAETARRPLDQYNTELMTVTTDIFDRSVRALAMPAAPPRPIRNPAFQHIRPLDQSLIDKRAVLDVAGPGLVVIELFTGVMATTEALVRSGLKVRKVYACELDKKAQKGFSRAASEAKGLRDPRTKLFTEAIRVVHTVTSVHGPCAYLFENVDASDHPQADVRDEFNDVVKGVLGPGFAFDAVAAGSLAHRNRRWWTNLVPSPLITEMVEKRFKQRPDFRRVQDILEPGRTAQRVKHSGAPGRHRVNETGQPLRALSTFVSLRGSHAYRVGSHSMILAANGEQEEPTALERERAMGFLENSTQAGPPITESDRRRLLGSTMDMHALTFLTQPPGTASSRPPAAAGGGRGQIGTPQKDPGKEQPEGDPPDLPDLLPSEEESEKLDWGLGGRGDLTPEQKQALEDLMDEFRDVQAADMSEMSTIIGKRFKIPVTDDTPIFKHQYRLAYAEKDILKDQVEERLKCGFFRRFSVPMGLAYNHAAEEG
ncbi:hypothetical protein KFL_000540020 [Klebsormidium nitens]|uniref:Uncharacterized protein n=1 Tax=Klebsormidium nitens TaxID=105231 RepID=A0A0U9HI94_KLENI|nr:hypothetical protein KFL_000540020 [Klebsormidium nitens]|eukprot:GAQ80425.1 hypothetical protein KFL_000540020 [Klebsormidium nitens]